MKRLEVAKALRYYSQFKKDKNKVPDEHWGILLIVNDYNLVEDYITNQKDRLQRDILRAFLSNKNASESVKKLNINFHKWFDTTTGSKVKPGMIYYVWTELKKRDGYCPWCDKISVDGGYYITKLTGSHCPYCTRRMIVQEQINAG